MDKEQFNTLIKEIGTCEDDSQRRGLLAQLQEQMSPNFDRMTELEASNEKLNQDNESLRSTNMQLFLRIGDHDGDKNKGGETPPEKKDFKDLFDEKGGIK